MKKRIFVSLLLIVAMLVSCVMISSADDSAASVGEILGMNYAAAGAKTAVVPGDTIKSVIVDETVYKSARTDSDKQRAFVLAAIFNGENLESVAIGNGCQVVSENSNYSIAFQSGTTLSVPQDMSGKSLRMFVLYDNSGLKPIAESKEYKYMETPTATTYANGVKLNWTAVDGAANYTVYRDGSEIETVNGTEYKDIYFRTIEQMIGENAGGVASGIAVDNMSEAHNYTVKANFGSKTIIAENSTTGKADPSKVMYYSLNGATSDKYQTNSAGKGNVFYMSSSSDALKAITKVDTSNTLLNENDKTITSLYSSDQRNDGTYINMFGSKPAFGLVAFKGKTANSISSATLFFKSGSIDENKTYKVLINMAAYGKQFGFGYKKLFVGDKNSGEGYFGVPTYAEYIKIKEDGTVESLKTSNNEGRIAVSDDDYATYSFNSKIIITKNNDNLNSISMSAPTIHVDRAIQYNTNGENAAIHSVGVIAAEDYLE